MPPQPNGVEQLIRPRRPPAPHQAGQRPKSGFWAKSSRAIALRNRAVRRLIDKARLVLPSLTEADLPALRSFCEIEVLACQLWSNLQDETPFRPNGEPRKVLNHYIRLKGVQLQYANALTMTPAARAAITGGDPSRAQDFIAQLASANVEQQDNGAGETANGD